MFYALFHNIQNSILYPSNLMKSNTVPENLLKYKKETKLKYKEKNLLSKLEVVIFHNRIIINSDANISLKSKIKTGDYYILKAFGKFHSKTINSRLVLPKFESIFKQGVQKSNLFYNFVEFVIEDKI